MRGTLVALLGAMAIAFTGGCAVTIESTDDEETVGVAEEGIEIEAVQPEGDAPDSPDDGGNPRMDPEPSPWLPTKNGANSNLPNGPHGPGDPGDPLMDPEPAPWDELEVRGEHD
jgi:hypothetical protein